MARFLTLCARLRPRDMIDALCRIARSSPASWLRPTMASGAAIAGPNCLILHYTGMPTGEAALKALTDPAREVSAHYLIWEDGAIDQLVAERDRAWHAGRGSWKGETDLNSASIGIEIVNPGHEGGSPPFPDRPDRGDDRARARHLRALGDRARAGPRPFRHRAGAQARSGGSVSVGRRSGGAASAIGPSPRRSPARRSSPMRRKGRRCGRCRRCSPSTATGWRSPGSTTARPGRWSRPSSAISGRSGSTAKRMPRPRATLKALIDGLICGMRSEQAARGRIIAKRVCGAFSHPSQPTSTCLFPCARAPSLSPSTPRGRGRGMCRPRASRTA